MKLLLSLFPGADLLGRGFEAEGFCVVRGPDILWGHDVRDFHVPPGKFEGVIGGPPCQKISGANRTNRDPVEGVKLVLEYLQIVTEAAPKWFLMENVYGLPDVKIHAPPGYQLQRFNLNAKECGSSQHRPRTFIFGSRDGSMLVLPRQVTPKRDAPGIDAAWPVTGDAPGQVTGRPVTGDAPGQVTGRPVTGDAPGQVTGRPVTGDAPGQVTGRPVTAPGASRCCMASEGAKKERRDWRTFCQLQGLPADFELPGLSTRLKYRLVGNGVTVEMARVVAIAIKARGVTAVKVCVCECGRPVTGNQTMATPGCRKRMQRKRDAAVSVGDRGVTALR